MLEITLTTEDLQKAPPLVRAWMLRRVTILTESRGPNEMQPACRGSKLSTLASEHEPGRKRPDDSNERRNRRSIMSDEAEDPNVRELIAKRAYELWENEGRPYGYDVINWHQAEQEILGALEGAAIRK